MFYHPQAASKLPKKDIYGICIKGNIIRNTAVSLWHMDHHLLFWVSFSWAFMRWLHGLMGISEGEFLNPESISDTLKCPATWNAFSVGKGMPNSNIPKLVRHFWIILLVPRGFILCNLWAERILLAHHITWGKLSTTLHPSSQGLLWSLRWSRVLWRPSLSTCLLSCLRGAMFGGRIQFTGRSFTTSFRTHLNAHYLKGKALSWF